MGVSIRDGSLKCASVAGSPETVAAAESFRLSLTSQTFPGRVIMQLCNKLLLLTIICVL